MHTINFIRFYRLFGDNIVDVRQNYGGFVVAIRTIIIMMSINIVSTISITSKIKKPINIHIRIHKNYVIRK